jgi:hypothetical protein
MPPSSSASSKSKATATAAAAAASSKASAPSETKAETVASPAEKADGARIRKKNNAPKRRVFNFWQFVKQSGKSGNHVEIVKERHPKLQFNVKDGCAMCAAVVKSFKIRYDPALVDSHLIQVNQPFLVDDAEDGYNTLPAGCWDGHDHTDMVTKLGDHQLTVDLGIHDVRDLSAEQVAGTIASRIAKRFPRKTRDGRRRITHETRKQKQIRVKWQHADWSKKYLPEAIALQKGSGKTFGFINLLNWNPPKRASIICDLPLFVFWIDCFIDYAQHVDGKATLMRIIGPQWLRALVEKNPRFLQGDVLAWDEAHFLRNSTEKQQTRFAALQTCNARFGLSGSWLCNGESDLFGFGDFMEVDLVELVERDVARQQEEELAGVKRGDAEVIAAVAARAARVQKRKELAAKKKKKKKKKGTTTAEAAPEKRKRGRPSKTDLAARARHMAGEEGQAEEFDNGHIRTAEGRIWVNDEIFVPTPMFFVELLKAIHGRVVFSDPFRDQAQRDKLRTQKLEAMRKQGKSETEIEAQLKRFEEIRHKEHVFPRVVERDIPLEMSWPQLYITATFSKNNFRLAGCKFQNDRCNFYEANSRMIANTYDTDKYSTKRRAYRIMGAERLKRPPKKGEGLAKRAELQQYNFDAGPKYITSTKAYRMAYDTLMYGMFPKMTFSSLLDHGTRSYEECLRLIESEGGPQFLPSTDEKTKKKKNGKTTAAPTTTNSHPMAWLIPPADSYEPMVGARPWNPTEEHQPVRLKYWTGDETAEQREKLCRDFRKKTIDDMCTSKAGNRGLDFGCAGFIQLMGPGDNLPEQKQSSSRVVRMGSDFAVVYILLYFMVHTTHAITEPELRELQEMWELQTGNPKGSEYWEDVRDEVLPELVRWAAEHRSFEERKRESNLVKAERLVPYDLTIECADPIAPMETKQRWNELTKQPKEHRLRTTQKKKPTEEDEVNKLAARLRADVWIATADQANLASVATSDEDDSAADDDDGGDDDDDESMEEAASDEDAADAASDSDEAEDSGAEADEPFGSDEEASSGDQTDSEDEDFRLYGKQPAARQPATTTRRASRV